MFKRILAACFIAVMAPAVANASTLIFSETLIPVSGNGDTTFFDDDNDFNESFDFSAVDYASVDRFELTLTIAGATDEDAFFGIIPIAFEAWKVRAQGSTSGFSDDLFLPAGFARLEDGTIVFTIDAASDTGGADVFAHSVATGEFGFWLSEFSADRLIDNPSITVSSAQLDVFGTLAPVPLPAGGLLLLGGLAGLGVARARRKA